jgi:hypothetical protein
MILKLHYMLELVNTGLLTNLKQINNTKDKRAIIICPHYCCFVWFDALHTLSISEIASNIQFRVFSLANILANLQIM